MEIVYDHGLFFLARSNNYFRKNKEYTHRLIEV